MWNHGGFYASSVSGAGGLRSQGFNGLFKTLAEVIEELELSMKLFKFLQLVFFTALNIERMRVALKVFAGFDEMLPATGEAIDILVEWHWASRFTV